MQAHIAILKDHIGRVWGYQVGVCGNAENHISILTTKLSQLSKISRYL